MQEFIVKNLITIIYIVFVLYGFFKGIEIGFLKKVLSFGSFVITIIITKYLTPVATSMIKDVTNVESTLANWIFDRFNNTNLYDAFNSSIASQFFSTGDISQALKSGVCTDIANVIINLASGILVFVATFFILKIIIKVLDIVDFVPIIGQLNKMLGGALGVFEVVLITWVILTVVKAVETLPELTVVRTLIAESPIISVLYDNNIVFNFFSGLLSFTKPL